jgi:hypothetical protein
MKPEHLATIPWLQARVLATLNAVEQAAYQ